MPGRRQDILLPALGLAAGAVAGWALALLLGFDLFASSGTSAVAAALTGLGAGGGLALARRRRGAGDGRPTQG